ncbi:MAG: beta-N-acetylhexosaminidase [Clostridia bacterium]|nr:beta-N-acetylhexosaminidase [Clostridia bacterium]
MKGYNSFGVMIDMSRNSAMTVDALKSYLTLIKKFGYDTVMLYTEDTYEVSEVPHFGYMRARYSKDELRELDSICASIGIELIPCIQTLAHLNAFIRWGKTPVDIDDILLADDERTYKLIESFIKTCRECFTSKRIHIGMDEAWKLGRGRHLNEHGYESANDIIKRHLSRVLDICKSYGFSPMIWSDMFIRSWNNNQYYIKDCKVPEEIKEAIPSEVGCVFWDYYHTDESVYDDMLSIHKQMSKDIWFAGGVWTWSGVVPHNTFSLETMLPAMRAVRKHRIKNVFFTMWGDDGGECSRFSVLPALFYLAQYAKGNEDDEDIKRRFMRTVGLSFDDFMKLDLPNRLTDNPGRANPSKYMLYSDPFLGFLDYTVSYEHGEKYEKIAKELDAVRKKSRKYANLFDTEARLCEVLSVKYSLGKRTREAYKAGDRAELMRLANEDYATLPRLYKAFYKSYKRQWMAENKSVGFDIQDLRLGGIIGRIEGCRQMLLDYLSGKLDKIDDLEFEVLPYGNAGEGMPIALNGARNYLSTNVQSI